MKHSILSVLLKTCGKTWLHQIRWHYTWVTFESVTIGFQSVGATGLHVYKLYLIDKAFHHNMVNKLSNSKQTNHPFAANFSCKYPHPQRWVFLYQIRIPGKHSLTDKKWVKVGFGNSVIIFHLILLGSCQYLTLVPVWTLYW